MKLKITALAVLAALPFISTQTLAQSTPAADLENRVFGSVFGEYYMPDTDKTESANWNFMEKDWGYGIEIGYYLNESWALRAEFAKLDLSSKLDGSDSDGNRLGIDVMYHLASMPSTYVVGGLKRMDAVQSSTAFNIGVGYKHFFNQNFGLFAEANRYQGIDESYADAGIKLGMTYLFGSAAAKVAPTPAPAPAPAPAPVQPAKPADSDNDGVTDANDRCPNTAATHQVDPQGCTVFTEEMQRVGDVDIEVKFGFDSASVSADQRSEVIQLAAFMKRFPESEVVIEGHASNIGNPSYNMLLSKRRAQSVADILTGEGVESSRITAVGYGVTRLRVQGNTPEAHAANQRIEAKVTAKVKEPVLR
ncbi:OmpA family protein [Arsukibacterium perlucidum]|uniref:OmpA family protein n=1 Tax=Arsukibacterium perlucidum TaxID=368811 RepID=UPI00037A1844|nr:OmpA family protein [Arsukibacterium perlucidum]